MPGYWGWTEANPAVHGDPEKRTDRERAETAGETIAINNVAGLSPAMVVVRETRGLPKRNLNRPRNRE